MKQFAVIIMLAFALLLFGCPGETQPNPEQSSAQPGNGAGISGAGDDLGEGAATPTGTDSGATATPGTEESPTDMLLGFLGASPQWSVTYDVSIPDGETFVTRQYLKDKNVRNDVIIDEIETRSYLVSGKFYSCMNFQSEWTCMDMTSIMGDEEGDLSQTFRENPGDYTVTPDGTAVVAGTVATCFKIEASEATTRYCVSSEGVPLLLQMTVDGKATLMQATSYEASASDSDFALPAEPTSYEGLPAPPN